MSVLRASARLLGGLLLLFGAAVGAETLNLAGTWHVTLDRADTGLTENWFNRRFDTPVQLPGSLQQARIGDPVTVDTKWTGGIFDRSWFTSPAYARYREPGNVKVPFWLQPDTHYTGVAWYQRTVEIPRDWSSRRVALVLERPHWRTTVWLDGREVGTQDAMSTAHVYDLGAGLAAGRHTLTIRVDNRLDPDLGENSHSISDHTQGNWNGVVGRIELVATAPVWIDHWTVDGRVDGRTAIIQGRLGRSGNAPWPAAVTLAADGLPPVQAPVASDGSFSARYAFPAEAGLWDEFTPTLHAVTATLPNGETRTTRFGFRHLGRDGRQLMINGRKLFLRGALDCAIFPETGHPPTDVPAWEKVFRVVKQHGLNHVRFHSWCPPEAAFVAADALGIYLQVEVATWPNHSTTLGDGKPVDAWVDAESARIVRDYGHHPSFVILCAGNEPSGPRHAEWLTGWVNRQRAADPGRLHVGGAGWPELANNDFQVLPQPRVQHWGEGLGSRLNALPPETVSDYTDFIRQRAWPIVAHEIGQWCAYPNFAEMPKYTGYLKPRNFEIFQETLAEAGMADQARDFLLSSGKLQVLCYKEEVESSLRTPEMGGFQLLGLQDFPGQGTALVGILDPFWEEKGYVTPAEFRRFCNSTVPLARLERRVFTSDDLLTAAVEVAHFGPAPLRADADWQLVDAQGTAVARGVFPGGTIPVGAGHALGRIQIPLATLPAPAKYRLVVSLRDTEFANDWEVWVYPPAPQVVEPAPEGVTIVSRLNAAALARLEAGGTVWLMADKSHVKPDPARGPIAFGFTSIFWNTAWTKGQPPHTFGILCDPRHAAFRGFPTDAHSNWQWWYPIRHATPMILDGLPKGMRPVVQVVDDWFANRKLGLVFEARVGEGRLLVSSINFRDPVLDPVRRQLRASLMAYVTSPAFAPSVQVAPEAIQAVFGP